MSFQFQDVETKTVDCAGVSLMHCGWRPGADGRYLHTLVFGSDAKAHHLAVGHGQEKLREIAYGDARIFTVQSAQPDAVQMVIDERPLRIPSAPSDLAFFADQNVGLAVHNLESLDVVLDWLRYHVTHHGMTGALILCRQRAELGFRFANALQTQAAQIDGLERLMLWSVDMPLGKDDLPSELHPLTVNGAPGKDRMEPQAPDPMRSPLGQFQVYELLHHAYLLRARAVMNLDVHDLLAPSGGPSVFDLAVESATGCVGLMGTQVYPWRLRDDERPCFGDHIYVRFDNQQQVGRWCVRPQLTDPIPIWRIVRVVGLDRGAEHRTFHRHIALKHPDPKIARLVPKSSLMQDAGLLERATEVFAHKPIHMPDARKSKMAEKSGTCIITTMKNEGPFILEWLAYHRVIGVDRFLVYTNDCTDGTDTFLDLLQQKGYVQHRNNAFEGSGLKPQHHALREGESEEIIQTAAWIICMDVDEYITVKTGDQTLAALYDAMGDANMIAINWRLFGNNDVHGFEDRPIIEQFTQCAPEYTRKPHQAWGFKTLFKNNGIFKKLGVHRPKGLKPQLWDDIKWLNGSGKPIPKDMFRNAWRSSTNSYGYDLVQLNHYAVRSAESFLVKRDRGRVNHVDRDQGLSYWFRMNNNAEANADILPLLPKLRAEMDRLLADPEIAAAHAHSVKMHREKITQLRATSNYQAFYETLTGPRQERLARLHHHFGANVFLAGPDVVPDDIVFADHPENFFFTVEAQETTH